MPWVEVLEQQGPSFGRFDRISVKRMIERNPAFSALKKVFQIFASRTQRSPSFQSICESQKTTWAIQRIPINGVINGPSKWPYKSMGNWRSFTPRPGIIGPLPGLSRSKSEGRGLVFLLGEMGRWDGCFFLWWRMKNMYSNAVCIHMYICIMNYTDMNKDNGVWYIYIYMCIDDHATCTYWLHRVMKRREPLLLQANVWTLMRLVQCKHLVSMIQMKHVSVGNANVVVDSRSVIHHHSLFWAVCKNPACLVQKKDCFIISRVNHQAWFKSLPVPIPVKTHQHFSKPTGGSCQPSIFESPKKSLDKGKRNQWLKQWVSNQF